MKVVIIGGVAGGASAAARLRRIDENAEIIMFERGQYISFANCGLPYYIGGTIKDREDLLIQNPEAMSLRYNLDIRIKSEVIRIDRSQQRVLVRNSVTGEEYWENYDRLILSPGSIPIKPAIPGIEMQNIYTVRSIPDCDIIKGVIDSNKPGSAVIIGGGFIGLEMAENLHSRGIEVAIVEMANQVMAPIDYEMAAIIHNHLLSKGIKLYLKDRVMAFNKDMSGIAVLLNSGRVIPADMAVLSIGVRPDTKLAEDAGLMLGERGGIKVNSYLQTSDSNIYAVGDAIEVKDFVNGINTLIPLAGPASKQGRIAANNIYGTEEKFEGTQGTSIVKVFDLTVATTGSNEKTLQKMGREYRKTYTESKSHAGYYPGAQPMHIKLLYSPDGTILGAQVIGSEGVDKRIDVLATAIRFGKKVYDLQELELAYAPPYSSAKDPVNMAGYVAANYLEEAMDVVYWDEIDDLDRDNTLILDIRDDEERELGFIEGSVHIPLERLRDNLNRIPRNKLIVAYCQVGLRAYIASRILMQNGFSKVKNLTGGYNLFNIIKETEKTLNEKENHGSEVSTIA